MRIWSLFIFIPSLSAETVVLFLDETTGANTITVNASANGLLNDTQISIYTGTIQTQISLINQNVTHFEMTGGLISASDTTFTFEIPQIFTQTASFQSTQATPVSPNGPEGLNPFNQVSSSEHYFLFNRGCVVTSGDFDNSKTLVRDSPFIARGDSNGTITAGPVVEVRSTLTGEVIGSGRRIELTLPLNSTTSRSDGGFTLNTETTGTITASGMLVDYNHPFFEWAASNAPLAQNALAFDADADQDGRQDGIAWALGFPSNSNASFPRPDLNPGTGRISFVFPGSTRSIVRLEESKSLNGDWLPVSGVASLPIGSTGISFTPAGDSGSVFYRFTATLN